MVSGPDRRGLRRGGTSGQAERDPAFASAKPASTTAAMYAGKVSDRRRTCIPMMTRDGSRCTMPESFIFVKEVAVAAAAAPSAPSAPAFSGDAAAAPAGPAPPRPISGSHSKVSPSSAAIWGDTTSDPAGAASSSGATCMMGSPTGTIAQGPPSCRHPTHVSVLATGGRTEARCRLMRAARGSVSLQESTSM